MLIYLDEGNIFLKATVESNTFYNTVPLILLFQNSIASQNLISYWSASSLIMFKVKHFFCLCCKESINFQKSFISSVVCVSYFLMCYLQDYVQIRESEHIIKHSFLNVKHYIIIIKACLTFRQWFTKVSQK